jgi:uncharacterized Rmd1/YagE family protein
MHLVATQTKSACAVHLGSRLKLVGLDAEGLNQAKVLSTSPLLLRFDGGGVAALFPYGTVVFIGISRADEESFVEDIHERIEGRLDTPVVAASTIEIGTSTDVESNLIKVKELSSSFLVVISDALAKNVALAFEEEEVRQVLVALEPFADTLANSGHLPWYRRRSLMRAVGHALKVHHRLLERVDVKERPSYSADDSEAESLRENLADAFHLKKRTKLLSRKLDVIEVMTTALAELIDVQREIRIELLIALLILVEIVFWLYDIIIRE